MSKTAFRWHDASAGGLAEYMTTNCSDNMMRISRRSACKAIPSTDKANRIKRLSHGFMMEKLQEITAAILCASHKICSSSFRLVPCCATWHRSRLRFDPASSVMATSTQRKNVVSTKPS